jgi:hypothetical protein
MIKYICIFFYLFILFPLTGQTDNSPLGARSKAMGGTSITLNDTWSCQNNQAGLASIKNASVGAYSENRFLIRQLALSGIAAAVPVKKGCFGLSYSSFGYSAYKESKLGLAYSIFLTDFFSVGVQLDYLHTGIADIYGTRNTFTVETGFQARINKQLIAAAHIYNPNRARLSNYPSQRIPSQLKMGLQYSFSEKMIALLEANYSSNQPININCGLEYIPAANVYIRSGASSSPTQFSFGTGFRYKEIVIDVCSSYHLLLGFSPAISFNYIFHQSTQPSDSAE